MCIPLKIGTHHSTGRPESRSRQRKDNACCLPAIALAIIRCHCHPAIVASVNRAIACIAFAFLLLSQQLGFAHAISHLSARVDSGSVQKKSLPAELQCEQCLHFSALGSGLTSSAPALALPAATAAPFIPIRAEAPHPRALRAFDSRAPPAAF